MGDMTREQLQAEATFVEDFPEFYATAWQDVFGALAVLFGDADLAQEATDEAMARAFARWEDVRNYDNPAGWVYRVGSNWAKNRLRSRWRELFGLGVEPTWEMATPNPDLTRAIDGLPVQLREVIVCRYVLDWSTTQTASALGIAEGTVKSRLSRAMRKLREVLT